MDAFVAAAVMLAVGAWIAIREARHRIARILAEQDDEDGPRDSPGGSGDTRGPSD